MASRSINDAMIARYVPAALAPSGNEEFLSQVDDGHTGALRRERECGRTADSTGASGDDGVLVL